MCTAISSSQIFPCICTLLKHTKQICSAIWLMRPIHPTRFNLWQCNHSLLLDWQLRFTIWITRVLQCVSTFTKTFVVWCAFVFVFLCVNYSLLCNGLNWILLFKALHFELWTPCLHQFIQTIQCTGCNHGAPWGTSLPTIEVWASFQQAPLWALCRSQLSNLVLISSLQVLTKTANHKLFSSSPS